MQLVQLIVVEEDSFAFITNKKYHFLLLFLLIVKEVSSRKYQEVHKHLKVLKLNMYFNSRQKSENGEEYI